MTFSGACTAGERIVIAGVGDLLFHDALQQQALAPKASYGRFFSSIEGVLKSADITYGNLEGPAAHAVAAGGGNARDPGRAVDGRVYGKSPGALIFNTHPTAVADLATSGFKVLSTANNHAADRGSLGIDRTIDALAAAGIAYTGTRRRTDEPGRLAGSWMAITEAKGVRVAWLACAYGTNGMPDRHNQVLLCYRDRDVVMGEIAKAAADPSIDAVILTPHWGLEGSATPLKGDRTYARDAIAAGASAVIGAHPHVLQPWERIETADGRDGLVVYSTGNFVSNQDGAAQRSGVIALLELVKPAAGRARLSAVGFIPTWVDKQGDKGHRVVELIGRTSETGAALKATLERLPAANRVVARDFRNLPRNCPLPVPETTPKEPLIVASAEIATPPLRMPIAAPPIDVSPAPADTPTIVAMLPPLALPTGAPEVAGEPEMQGGVTNPTLASAAEGPAAVDINGRAADIAAGGRGQECRHVCDLVRLGHAVERQVAQHFLPAVFIAERRLRPRLRQRDAALGAGCRRIDPEDAHAPLHGSAADGPGECHQRGIAGRPADVVVARAASGRAGDVDDGAGALLLHAGEIELRHVDVTHHLEVPRLLPACHGQIEQAAAGDGAGVVDQNRDVGVGRRHPLPLGRARQIGGACFNFAEALQFAGRCHQLVGIARHQDHRATLLQERLAAGAADALRATGDEYAIAFEAQIHAGCVLLSVSGNSRPISAGVVIDRAQLEGCGN
jgi:hypothetical protein